MYFSGKTIFTNITTGTGRYERSRLTLFPWQNLWSASDAQYRTSSQMSLGVGRSLDVGFQSTNQRLLLSGQRDAPR